MSLFPSAAGRRFVAEAVLVYLALTVGDVLFGEDDQAASTPGPTPNNSHPTTEE